MVESQLQLLNLFSLPGDFSLRRDLSDSAMEGDPWFCLGMAVGTKLNSAEELPPYLLKLIERHDPELIHNVEQWSVLLGRLRGV